MTAHRQPVYARSVQAKKWVTIRSSSASTPRARRPASARRPLGGLAGEVDGCRANGVRHDRLANRVGHDRVAMTNRLHGDVERSVGHSP